MRRGQRGQMGSCLTGHEVMQKHVFTEQRISHLLFFVHLEAVVFPFCNFMRIQCVSKYPSNKVVFAGLRFKMPHALAVSEYEENSLVSS